MLLTLHYIAVSLILSAYPFVVLFLLLICLNLWTHLSLLYINIERGENLLVNIINIEMRSGIFPAWIRIRWKNKPTAFASKLRRGKRKRKEKKSVNLKRGLLSSPKKPNGRICFVCFLLFTVNKSTSSVWFLGESTARHSAFWFYLTFSIVYR